MVTITQLFIKPRMVGVADTFEQAEKIVQDYFQKIELTKYFRWDRRNSTASHRNSIVFQPSQSTSTKFAGTVQLKNELVAAQPGTHLTRSPSQIVEDLIRWREYEISQQQKH